MEVDSLINAIAEYIRVGQEPTDEALNTARLCLADSLGCAIASLQFSACTRLLGPIVPGTTVPNGCHIPGRDDILDPVRGAFNLGAMIRWLDYNDTWLAAEWGHPSDNIGGLLALSDYLSRKNQAEGFDPISCKELLRAIIKAYEIQGILALNTSFNRIGFDHVALVKIATAASACCLLGCDYSQIVSSLSNAWIDAGPLRTYRHAPNVGSRKSWAAGDATSRGVQLALMAFQGEMGYKTPLSAREWGVSDVLFSGKTLELAEPLTSYVIENILFKVAFPAEFHAQTAVEAAFELYKKYSERLHDIDNIESIEIKTHESAIRIIDKKGYLNNPADRDHCLQYMVAIALLYGELTAEHYEEKIASNKKIDELRSKMVVKEDLSYTKDYLDKEKRSIANSITIYFKDGFTGTIAVEYPLGHKRRRKEAIPLLFEKLKANLSKTYDTDRIKTIVEVFQDQDKLEKLSVPSLVDLFKNASSRKMPSEIPL